MDISSTLWSIHDVRGPNMTEEMKVEEEELRNATIEAATSSRRPRRDPNNTTPYSFIEKYFEMQGRMLAAHGNLGDHQFGAPPSKWPFLGKTLPYWLHHNTNVRHTPFSNDVMSHVFIFPGASHSDWQSNVMVGVVLLNNHLLCSINILYSEEKETYL